MKKFTVTILTCLLTACAAFFVGCEGMFGLSDSTGSSENSDGVTTYTVEFNSDGGSFVESQQVEHGEKIPQPTAPSKEHHIFDGWYDGDTLWSFAEDVVTEDMTLTAHWTQVPQYTVTFTVDETPYDTKTVYSNEKVSAPTAPSKAYYDFAGWYNDDEIWEFDADMVTSNVTLTAKWTPISYTITYEIEDGTLPSDAPTGYTVETETFILPTPTRTNYAFSGWTKNGEPITQIEKGTTGNVTLTAVWEASTEGLVFSLSDYQDSYVVRGYTGTETKVCVPSTYKGMSVTEISTNAFYGCTTLQEIVLPEGITKIGSWAFNGCTNLQKIEFPNTLEKILNYAFEGCIRLEEVTLSNNVTYISDYAFNKCTGLVSVSIGSGVTYIGSYAFGVCSNLTNITVDENNTKYQSIDGNLYTKGGKTLLQYALGKKATSFTIPDGVTKLQYGAVNRGNYLQEVIIPSSVTSIEGYVFAECDSLTNITVDVNNTKYQSIDGDLYSKDGKTLVQYATGKKATSYTVPQGVTAIGENAFSGSDNLTKIVVSNSVITIGAGAFSYNSNLTEVVIPNSVTFIDNYAFWYCNNLTQIFIPKSVQSIGSDLFYKCDKLTVYCEAESCPSGWDWYWNNANRPVVWGHTGE